MEERLMISSAGIWRAQDLLGTLQEQTLRGMGMADAELRYVAPELFTGGPPTSGRISSRLAC